jgi:hypothetical protein
LDHGFVFEHFQGTNSFPAVLSGNGGNYEQPKMKRDAATKTRHDSAKKDVGAMSGAFSKASDLA